MVVLRKQNKQVLVSKLTPTIQLMLSFYAAFQENILQTSCPGFAGPPRSLCITVSAKVVIASVSRASARNSGFWVKRGVGDASGHSFILVEEQIREEVNPDFLIV